MTPSPRHLKERLLKAVDKDAKVLNMGEVLEVISLLKETKLSKEALEETRLGKLVNEIRRNSRDEELKRLCRQLILSWQKFLRPVQRPASQPANSSSSGGNSEQQTNDSRLSSKASGGVQQQQTNDSKAGEKKNSSRKRHIPENSQPVREENSGGGSSSSSRTTAAPHPAVPNKLAKSEVGNSRNKRAPSSPALSKLARKGGDVATTNAKPATTTTTSGTTPPLPVGKSTKSAAANRLPPASPVPAKRTKVVATTSPAPAGRGLVKGERAPSPLAAAGEDEAQRQTPPPTGKTARPPQRFTPPLLAGKADLPQRLTPPAPTSNRAKKTSPGLGGGGGFLAINGVPTDLAADSRLDSLVAPTTTTITTTTTTTREEPPLLPAEDHHQRHLSPDSAKTKTTDTTGAGQGLGGGGQPLEAVAGCGQVEGALQRNGHQAGGGNDGPVADGNGTGERLTPPPPPWEEEDPLPPSPPAVVTEADLDRLDSGQWEGVNGCYGDEGRGTWSGWDQCVSHAHADGTALHILPYVCLLD